jgi:hypothetical protein
MKVAGVEGGVCEDAADTEIHQEGRQVNAIFSQEELREE